MCVLYKQSCDLLNIKPGNNSFNGLSHDQSQWKALVNATLVYNGTTNSSSACSHVKLNKSILVYKSRQDAQVTEFILSDNCSTCFRRHYHPSSGAQNNCNYRHRWTKPLISVDHRHHAYVSYHMKTKTDQHATYNTLKSVPTLPR